VARREIPEEFLRGYDRILDDVAQTGRRLNRDEPTSRRAVGEQAAEASHSLRSLINGHLAVTRAAWPRHESAPADSALAAVAQVVDALAEGYERTQHLAVRQEEAERREFIDDLLHGGGELVELALLGRFGDRQILLTTKDGRKAKSSQLGADESTCTPGSARPLTSAARPGPFARSPSHAVG
jgi:hypothetical protein